MYYSSVPARARRRASRRAVECQWPIVVLFLIAATGRSVTAHAQRGGEFVEQQAVEKTPVSGFSELMGTNQAARGDLVTDFPLFGLEYGVTDNLAVGTALIAPLASSFRGWLLRGRYRFYSDGRTVSVMDGLGYYGGGDTRALFGWVGNHTAYYLTNRDVITASVLLVRLSLREELDDPPMAVERATAHTVLLGLGYQRSLSWWAVLRTGVYVTPVSWGSADSGTVSVSGFGDITDDPGGSVLARAILSARLSENWLLSGGGIAVVADATVGPWIDISKKW